MKTNLYRFILAGFITIITLSGSAIMKHDKKSRTAESGSKIIRVYPVHISKINRVEAFDTIIARQITDYINGNLDIRAEYIAEQPGVNAEWFMNEAKMLKRSCNAFSASIKDPNCPGQYGLLVEFLWLAYELDVHYSLVEISSGKAISKGLVNSHHPLHKQILPKNNEDAYKLFCILFDKDMKNLEKKGF